MVLSPHTVELLCDNFSTHERSTDQCSQFCIMCMIGGTYETWWIPFYKRSSNSTLFFFKTCNSERGKVVYGVMLPMTMIDKI